MRAHRMNEGVCRCGCPVLAPPARLVLVLWPKPRPRQPPSAWSHGGSPGPAANAASAHMVCGPAEPHNTLPPLGTRVLPLGGNRPGA